MIQVRRGSARAVFGCRLRSLPEPGSEMSSKVRRFLIGQVVPQLPCNAFYLVNSHRLPKGRGVSRARPVNWRLEPNPLPGA